MYREHFGLDDLPFSIAPDPRYLYMSEQHREALAHLVYGLNSDGGFVLLTGEVGTGKTTVCRCLLEQLPEDADIAFILNPKLSAEELLGTICDELGIAYPEGNPSVKVFIDRINAYLLDAHARGRKTVLIIEEAQNLSTSVLEQLRLLTNLETSQRKLLQIIMLGQPELREVLSRPELRQLEQRVTARYHLGPLSKNDLKAYVAHRLSVSGIYDPIFTSAAIEELYRRSRGIPRLINVICDRALLGAYVQGQRKVDRSTLAKAASEVLGDRPVQRRVLKWVLTGSVLVISVTALATTLYNHKIQLFSGNKSRLAEKPLISPGVQGAGHSDLFAAGPANSGRAKAYQAILKVWNVPVEVPAQGTGCDKVGEWGLDCVDAEGNLSSLVQLNRPAVLRLSDGHGREAYVALVSVRGRTATVVADGETRQVSIEDISRNWQGSYTVLWRVPRKYHSTIQAGDKGREVLWLERQLALVMGGGVRMSKSGTFDDSLARQVKEFQGSEGLIQDGVVGPQTFLHLDAALSRREPALAGKER